MTPKQERFIAEYLIDLNATQAAIRAGYSRKTAADIGRQLLRRTPVREFLAERQAKQMASVDLSAVRVLEELRRIAFSDLRRLVDERGQLRPVEGLAPDDAAGLASYENCGGTVKVRLWDKLRALDLLAKHFGLLKERIEITGDRELVTRLMAARSRTSA